MRKLFILALFLPLFGAGQDILNLEQRVEFHPQYYDTIGNFYGFFAIEKDIPKPRYDEFRRQWISYRTVGNIQQTKTSGQWYFKYFDSDSVERRRYLGWRTNNIVFGCTVFCNSDSTKHWVWQMDEETGLPYKIDVPEVIINIK